MNRDEYLRLLAEGFELAFEKGDLEGGAERYSAALDSLAPGELAYSDHLGEYAAILGKLNQPERALAEYRRAVDSAMREVAGDPDSAVLAMHRRFLGEHLLSMGKPEEALEAVTSSLVTRTSLASPLLMVQAESLAAVGRMDEAKQVALQALARATEAQRAHVKERLSWLLEGS